MSLTTDAVPAPARPAPAPTDHRGSPIPTWSMITTRFMELRRRRGLMIAMIFVTIGIPVIYAVIATTLHIVDPKTYGPPGGFNTFQGLSVGVLYLFGFVVAAALGATAGSVDLSEGMFRHLVITGRSRLALYIARIPAGLGIVVPLVAIGFTTICVFSVATAPTTFKYGPASIPAGLSSTQLQQWAADNYQTVVCVLPYSQPTPAGVDCRAYGGGGFNQPSAPGAKPLTEAQLQAFARTAAVELYPDYSSRHLNASASLMVKTGLWIELEAIAAFVIGLGLGSLLGQRTIAVILMIILEIIITPLASRAHIPHLINVQRGILGVAMSRLRPNGITAALGGGGGNDFHVTESLGVAIAVIAAWLIVWSALGAWRMMKRDA